MAKQNGTHFIVIGLCILCAVLGLFIFYPSNKQEPIKITNDESFTKDNWNIVQTDTFTHLIEKKYGASANIKRSATQIKVNITGANMKTRDFFNGNTRLLEFKLNDHGFEIKYSKNSNQINAIFKRKAGGTVVPNDVLINLAK